MARNAVIWNWFHCISFSWAQQIPFGKYQHSTQTNTHNKKIHLRLSLDVSATSITATASKVARNSTNSGQQYSGNIVPDVWPRHIHTIDATRTLMLKYLLAQYLRLHFVLYVTCACTDIRIYARAVYTPVVLT